jgi:hypothetical protein
MSIVHLEFLRIIHDFRLIADIHSIETKKAGPFLTLPIKKFVFD